MLNSLGKLVDTHAVQLDQAGRSACFGNLFLRHLNALVAQQHLDHRRAAVRLADLHKAFLVKIKRWF